MGFKCNIVALSEVVPRHAILGLPQDSAVATWDEVDRLWPLTGKLDGEVTIDEGIYCHDDALYAAKFGDTVIFGCFDPTTIENDPVVEKDPRTTWVLSIHSVVDACRYVGPTSEMDVWNEEYCFHLKDFFQGELMEFEVPYFNGEHRMIMEPEEAEDFAMEMDIELELDPDGQYSLWFHPLELGNAAAAWMFGIHGETSPPDAVMNNLDIDPAASRLPMYRFTRVTNKLEALKAKKEREGRS